MRLLIAGPLPEKDKSGGVAVFDENLAVEAKRRGYEVLFATKQVSSKINLGIPCISVYNLRKIRKFNPDVVISSLQYSFILSMYNLKCTKIHILHGFTNFKSYSTFKFFIMHCIDRLIAYKYDVILANSKYTEYVNDLIFDIKSNGIFYIGLDKKTISYLSNNSNKKLNAVLYVGRLVKAKNVDKALEAFVKMGVSEASFKVVGYGPEYQNLRKSFSSQKIKFTGGIKHQEIFNEYKKAKVFISLNNAEPFGITYVEALAANMFIIAPNRGGQVEFLKQFSERVALVDINNKSEIAEAIKLGLRKQLPTLSKEELSKLSFGSTFDQISSFFNK